MGENGQRVEQRIRTYTGSNPVCSVYAVLRFCIKQSNTKYFSNSTKNRNLFIQKYRAARTAPVIILQWRVSNYTVEELSRSFGWRQQVVIYGAGGTAFKSRYNRQDRVKGIRWAPYPEMKVRFLLLQSEVRGCLNRVNIAEGYTTVK